MLQQYLPFTVLKLNTKPVWRRSLRAVATVLTVYGIETTEKPLPVKAFFSFVATVLTVYGIETQITYSLLVVPLQLQQYLPFTVLKPKISNNQRYSRYSQVATVLTVYGIET